MNSEVEQHSSITPNKTIKDKLWKLIISKDKYLNSKGDILLGLVVDDINNENEELINLLSSDEKIRNIFFRKINDISVFRKKELISIINSYEFMTNSYTKFCEKIGLVDRKNAFLSDSNDVVLSFPYKDCYLEGGQTKEDQKYTEVFYNEVLAKDEVERLLAPKVFSNVVKYLKDENNNLQKENPTTFNIEKDNLLIKGNNLVALSSILERYEGKIKCIYIDPPYNTGSDSFKYNDNFNHSTWMVFMKNRLKLAHKLLKNDGYLFVQCDDNEQAYLKVLLDELFSRENFINIVTVKTKIGGVSGSSEGKSLKDATEFINIYAKNKNEAFLNPVYIKTPLYRYIQQYKEEGKSWKYTSVITNLSGKKKLKEIDGFTFYSYDSIETKSITTFARENDLSEEDVYNQYNEKIFRTTNAQSSIRQFVIEQTKDCNAEIVSCEYKPIKGKNQGELIELLYKDENRNMLMFLSERVIEENNKKYYLEKISTLWSDINYNNISKDGGVDFSNGKKPETLIKRILELSTKENDIVLDFHLGSGTTSAVAHKMNRKWIGIEQLNYGENDSTTRLKNVVNKDTTGISKDIDINWNGGGSFIYCELAKDENYKYLEKISFATNENIDELKNDIIKNAIIRYEIEDKRINENWNTSNLSLGEKKDILKQLIDKNYIYINYTEMDDDKYKYLSETDKAFTKSFYEGV